MNPFEALPPELLVEIICHLHVLDVCALIDSMDHIPAFLNMFTLVTDSPDECYVFKNKKITHVSIYDLGDLPRKPLILLGEWGEPEEDITIYTPFFCETFSQGLSFIAISDHEYTDEDDFEWDPEDVLASDGSNFIRFILSWKFPKAKILVIDSSFGAQLNLYEVEDLDSVCFKGFETLTLNNSEGGISSSGYVNLEDIRDLHLSGLTEETLMKFDLSKEPISNLRIDLHSKEPCIYERNIRAQKSVHINPVNSVSDTIFHCKNLTLALQGDEPSLQDIKALELTHLLLVTSHDTPIVGDMECPNLETFTYCERLDGIYRDFVDFLCCLSSFPKLKTLDISGTGNGVALLNEQWDFTDKLTKLTITIKNDYGHYGRGPLNQKTSHFPSLKELQIVHHPDMAFPVFNAPQLTSLALTLKSNTDQFPDIQQFMTRTAFPDLERLNIRVQKTAFYLTPTSIFTQFSHSLKFLEVTHVAIWDDFFNTTTPLQFPLLERVYLSGVFLKDGNLSVKAPLLSRLHIEVEPDLTIDDPRLGLVGFPNLKEAMITGGTYNTVDVVLKDLPELVEFKTQDIRVYSVVCTNLPKIEILTVHEMDDQMYLDQDDEARPEVLFQFSNCNPRVVTYS